MAKRAKKPTVFKTDSWQNVLTGMGTSRDKRTGSYAQGDLLTYSDLIELYRSDDIISRIIDMPADEMVREWFDVVIPDDKESGELIGAKLDDLHAQEVCKQAIRASDLFGGGIVLIGVNDGASLSEPLDITRVKSVDFLNWFDSSEVVAVSWQNNPAAKDFGCPLTYDITPRALGSGASSLLSNVHHSRLLIFTRPVISRDSLIRSKTFGVGFGESVLLPLYSVIRDYGSTWGSIGHLLQDFSQSVFKFAGLAEALMTDNASAVRTRLETMDMQRSTMRSILLDKDDEFQRMATPLTGLPELVQQFGYRIAAAAKMPVSLLLGQSPTGLNATGESDVRWFYDHIKRRQDQELKPQIEKLVKILMGASDSPTKGEPDNWSIRFDPLWQMTDQQKADVRLKMAQTDQVYLQNGVLSPEEVTMSRFGGDDYSLETTLMSDVERNPQPLPQDIRSTGNDNTSKPSQDPSATSAAQED